MRRLIAALAITAALLAFNSAAYAACSFQNITTPDGRIIMCSTCCLPGGFCNTVCQ